MSAAAESHESELDSIRVRRLIYEQRASNRLRAMKLIGVFVIVGGGAQLLADRLHGQRWVLWIACAIDVVAMAYLIRELSAGSPLPRGFPVEKAREREDRGAGSFFHR